MKIVHRHILGDYVITFAVTFSVIMFVMSLGVLFKSTDLIARGIPWRSVFYVFLMGLPSILPFSIPMSVLTASLLVFGRLSADGEITAMKACGLSMWQIVSRPVLFSLLLTALCMQINADIAPMGHFAMRKAVRRLGMESPIGLLEKGYFIRDFPGLTIYIGNKKGNKLEHITIYDVRTPKLNREIRAKRGDVSMDTKTQKLFVNLYEVRVDPVSEESPGPAFCEHWPLTIDISALKSAEYEKRNPDLTLDELADKLRRVVEFFPKLKPDELARQRMSLAVELNKRMALSTACFSFAVLGIPLGIRQHRKESSVGVAISLFLVLNFYVFILLAESCATRPATRPDLVVWLPVIVSILLGIRLVRRSN